MSIVLILPDSQPERDILIEKIREKFNTDELPPSIRDPSRTAHIAATIDGIQFYCCEIFPDDILVDSLDEFIARYVEMRISD